jgi:hypothetical protein
MAFFEPQCLLAAATCDQATALRVGAALRLAPGIEKLAGAQFTLRTRVTRALRTIAVSDIQLLGPIVGSRACPAGSFMTGADAFGNPVCVALPSCPSGLLSGVDASGTAICRYPKKIYRCLVLGGSYQDTFMSQDPGCEGHVNQGNLYDGLIPN